MTTVHSRYLATPLDGHWKLPLPTLSGFNEMCGLHLKSMIVGVDLPVTVNDERTLSARDLSSTEQMRYADVASTTTELQLKARALLSVLAFFAVAATLTSWPVFFTSREVTMLHAALVVFFTAQLLLALRCVINGLSLSTYEGLPGLAKDPDDYIGKDAEMFFLDRARYIQDAVRNNLAVNATTASSLSTSVRHLYLALTAFVPCIALQAFLEQSPT